MSTDAPSTARKRLDSWKEIAEYLGRDVRTAMRWEQDLSLPIHRVPGGQRRGVFAVPEEIDAWLAARGNQLPDTTTETTAADSEPAPSRRLASRWYLLAAAALVVALGLLLVLRRVPTPRQGELTFKLADETFRFLATANIPLRGLGAFVAADLNHDGWTDLVIGGAPTNRIAVLINRGGKFDSPVFYEGCASSVGPNAADFDGDGNLDIAIGCHDTRQVQVWWGDGKGGFAPPLTMEATIEPVRCVAGDFNRDGIADFVVDASGGGPVIVFTGHRDRTFTPTTWDAGTNAHAPLVGDLDGDGLLDIAIGCYSAACRSVTLLRGLGDGTFKPKETIPAASMPWAMVAADLTGDNIPDLYASSITGEESFFAGIGQGKFLPSKLVLHTTSLVTPTVFSERRNYILDLQLYPAQLRLLSFDSQGNVTASNSARLNGNPLLSLTADFNNDGRNDIAVIGSRDNATYVTIYLHE
jgi:hypothetical protein